MRFRKDISWTFVWSLVAFALLNLLFFFAGFFPLEQNKKGFATSSDTSLPHGLCGLPSHSVHDTTYAPLHPKLVLLVVDALRYDFVNSSNFPFTSSLLKTSQAMKYKSKAFAPTVTLPRIKSILSGTIPGYMDILINLDASRMDTDNIIYQAHQSLKKSYFYGDDTWLKLFPAEYFAKHKGTTSFYVKDYVEVDATVTDHLNSTINEDWDFMFLHYLGLDHLGHVIGPDNPLVVEKLLEMDSVVQHLHKTLPSGSVILLTGDHGMSVTGNHGGTSHEEIDTPIVVMLTGQQQFLGTRPEDDHLTAFQIDIAPTIALLMGIPIPICSYGSVLPQVLLRHPKLNDDSRLFRLQYNTNQLLQVFAEGFESEMEKYQSVRQYICNYMRLISDDGPLDPKGVETAQQSLFKSMDMMKKMIIGRRSVFNMGSIVVSILSVFITTATISICAFADDLLFLLDLKALFTSFILAFSTSAFISTVLDGATLLEQVYNVLKLTLAICFLISAIPNFSLKGVKARIRTSSSYTYAQFLGTLLYGASLIGSSFVEEEHQTWYFFSVSSGVFAALFAPSMSICKADLIKVFRVLLMSRILRGWNRTGDKWIHLPAYVDYVMEQPLLCSILVVVTAFNVIQMLSMRNSRLQARVTGVGAGLILLFKLYSVNYGEDQPVAVWLYLIVPVTFVLGIWEFVTSEQKFERHLHPLNTLSNIWMLMGFLLQRPENVFMFGLEIFLENAVHNVVKDYPMGVQAVTYTWFANAAFFHQGNSNKLSTIDVASGYFGISFYEPTLVALLMWSHTFSGYVHWLIMFWRRSCYNLGPKDKLRMTCLVLCIKYALTCWYLVVMTVQKDHLFIWSVFSPKGLYEMAHTVTTTFTLFVVYLCNL